MRRLAPVLLLLPLLVACGGSEQDAYCRTVEDHQQELSDIVGSGEPDALLRALDVFEELQDDAPGDISDEWQQVVGRIEALRDALQDAGVEPAAYDRDDPPADMSEAGKAAIDAAAKQLGSGTTVRALQDLDQHARDVCRTPLTL